MRPPCPSAPAPRRPPSPSPGPHGGRPAAWPHDSFLPPLPAPPPQFWRRSTATQARAGAAAPPARSSRAEASRGGSVPLASSTYSSRPFRLTGTFCALPASRRSTHLRSGPTRAFLIGKGPPCPAFRLLPGLERLEAGLHGPRPLGGPGQRDPAGDPPLLPTAPLNAPSNSCSLLLAAQDRTRTIAAPGTEGTI